MLEHLPEIEKVVQWFKLLDTIILWDLNLNLDDARSLRSQRVAELLMEFGLIGLVYNFRQRPRF